MSEDLVKSRLTQVFSFAKALHELRNPVVSRIENQRWNLGIDKLPVHQCIYVKDMDVMLDQEGEGNNYIIKVKRPILTEAPEPPEEILTWITGRWQDIEGNVNILEEIVTQVTVNEEIEELVVKLEDNEDIKQSFNSWIEDRNLWLENEKPARRVMEVFNEFYKLYSILEKESETVELVLGDGILFWELPSGFSIHHPVLLQKAILTFDSNLPEFRIQYTDDSVKLYTALFRGIPEVQGNMIAKSLEDLEQGNYDPMESINTSSFLKRLVMSLSSEGDLVETDSLHRQSVIPSIIRKPVLFLRKRSLGFEVAINSIIDDISANEEIPSFIKSIVGATEEVFHEDEQVATSYHPNGQDKDVLFTKPSNAEQLAVAKYFQKSGAVLVQGPPGTGKTHTIANLVGHLLSQGKNILITSHSEKALSVLRDKIVEPLQPLCLPLLSDERGREEMEKTIDALNEKRASLDINKLRKEVTALQEKRKALLNGLEEKREELKLERQNEYRDIVVSGNEYSPVKAAKYVAEFQNEESWIPSPVALGAILPLSKEELDYLYETNVRISKLDEEEHFIELPRLDEIMTFEEFNSLLDVYNNLESSNYSYKSKLWKADLICTSHKMKELSNKLEDIISEIQEGWISQPIEAGYKNDKNFEYWLQLIGELERFYEAALQYQAVFIEYSPQLPEDCDLREFKKIAEDIACQLKDEERISKTKTLFNPSWKKLLNAVKVNEVKPENKREIEAVLSLINLEINKQRVLQRWNRQVVEIGGPSLEEQGEKIENICIRYARILKAKLTWYKEKWSVFVKELETLGFNWNDFQDEMNENLNLENELLILKNKISKELLVVIAARNNFLNRNEIKYKFEELTKVLAKYNIGDLNLNLQRAVNSKEASLYNECYERLLELNKLQADIEKRYELIKKLENAAPQWAKLIQNREGIHGVAIIPHNYERAWLWRQLSDELDRRGKTSLVEIQSAIVRLENEVRYLTVDLVEKMAWKEKLERLTQKQNQALESWKLTVRAIGKGTGKRVPHLQAQSRLLMKECQSAVPVWIMPLSRVVENFDPSKNKFDVVIIDEASQADIMALIALYMGKQAIIVGDDEQVSPVTVGTKIEEVQNLIDTHLDGIMNKQLYTGQFSIYDVAKTAGFQPVCLREHFRCLSPIIQFSNYLSYDGKIKALREEGNVSCKPAVVPYRIEGAVSNSKVNKREAEVITSLILACIEEVEYEDKTFGVISLVGEEQALLIDQMLHKYLEPSEYVNRKIQCGNSAQFQGDERDIIFLSMVDGPGEKGPLTLRGFGAGDMTKKRYNVAASRAADQMWVMYSLNPETDLKTGDLRLRLIQHAKNPSAIEQSIEEKQKEADSEFERLVMERLIKAGYKVTPQWKVGSFRIDIVVEGAGRKLAVECDGERWHGPEKLAEDMNRQAILERLGWTFVRIRGSQFFRNPEEAMLPVYNKLMEMQIPAEGIESFDEVNGADKIELTEKVKRRAQEIRDQWENPHKKNKDIKTIAQNNLEPIKEMVNSDENNNISVAQTTNTENIQQQGFDSVQVAISDDSLGNGIGIQTTVNNHENEVAAQTIIRPSRNIEGLDDPYQELFEEFRKIGLEMIDKRSKGGCLWIIGGAEFKPLFNSLRKRGAKFTYSEKGGRATKGRAAWYMK